MEALVSILGILLFPIGIGMFICWIMVIIKAFKKEEGPLMGILCIVLCSLGALVIGWINAKKWDCKKLMLVFTALAEIYIVVMVIFGVGGGLAAASLQEGGYPN